MRRYGGAIPVLVITSGLIVWASCFVVLYAALSLGCTYGPPAFSMLGMAGLTWILLFLWIIHLVALVWLIARTRSASRHMPQPAAASRFATRTTLGLQVASLIGTIWIGFPVLMLPACL